MPNSDLKKVYACLFVIGFLYLLAIFAGFFAPMGEYYEENISISAKPEGQAIKRLAYSPPIRLNFNFTGDGIFFYPYILKNVGDSSLDRDFIKEKRICHVSLFVKNKKGLHLFGSKDCPNDFHLLGTDRLGRDYLSRLIFGLRPGLFAAFIGILIAFPIGTLYGTISGYLGSVTDELMMRFVEVILSFPSFYLLVILAGLLPPSLSNFHKLILITAIMSFIGWAGLARVVRGQVLALRKKEFVQYAQLIGKSQLHIMLREIIPQLSTYLVIAIAISFPSYLLGEATLSFLGLGINEPDSSLGSLLSEGRQLTNLFLRPWLAATPALLLVLIAWTFNTMGDSLRNIFDPKGNTRE